MSRAGIDCPECGSLNSAGTKFCEACGLLLATAAQTAAESTARPAAKSTDRRSRRRAPDKAHAIAIEHQLRKARRVLRGVRMLYVLSSIVAVLVLVGVIADGGGEPVQLVVVMLQALILVAGALFLFVQPLAFTLVAACFFTLVAVLGVIEIRKIPILPTGMAIWLWCTLPIVAHVMKLKREYPDLVDTSKLKQRKVYADAPTSAALARSEQRGSERRRAQLKLFGWVGGAILVVGLMWLPVRAAMRSEPEGPKVYTADEIASINRRLGGALGQFRRAWGASDLDALELLFVEGRRLTFWPKVLRLVHRKGWTGDLPELGPDKDVHPGTPESQSVWFRCGAGTLKTSWQWEEERWWLYKLTTKDVD